MKHLSFLLCLVLCLAACKDDDTVEPGTTELSLDIVTGLQARDINGAPIGQLGNPNTLPGEVDIFPNPALGSANIQYFGGASLQVVQYWIFPADQNTDFANVNFSTLLNNDTYSADEISDLNVTQTNLVNLSAFAITLDDFSAGYYRIFYLMSDETLLWDNIYVDPSAGSPSDLLNQVTEDW
ncbi:MAG: hypothetical protein AAFP77_03085 [Bacteroidota bacterium]